MRRALVIGASAGVGRYFAERLTQDGVTVTGVGRRDLEPHPCFRYLQRDLRLARDVQSLCKLVSDEQFDLLVLNAAAYGIGVTADHHREVEDMFQVNAIAPFAVGNAFVTSVQEQRHKSCVVVNSDAIFHAGAQTGVYAASKAALRVLTTTLAQEARERNASVATLLFGPLGDERKRRELATIAERRGKDPAEITRLFLRRSNPAFVVDDLIELEPCYSSLLHISTLGRSANGMMCRIDGGSAGSLI